MVQKSLEAGMDQTLVLFDIDGTLLWSDGSGRAAMQQALTRVYGTAGPIDDYYFGGRTDREAVRDLMRAVGFKEEAIWRGFGQLEAALADELRSRLASGDHNVQPCPGASDLVARLEAHPQVIMGLLTGNMKTTAWIKLRAAGFDPALFLLGAYGSESTDRVELAELAVARATALSGTTFQGEQIVIVGDTPADIACAQGVGGRSIAPLTGWHDAEELEAAGAWAILENLADTQYVLELIAGSSEV
jgi:phosphoglycolate phosphatase-like HAD superfamily hydrolase